MTKRGRRYDDNLIVVALLAAQQALLRRVPAVSRKTASYEAEAIAMGILHGCCGPNGDFSADYRTPEPEDAG